VDDVTGGLFAIHGQVLGLPPPAPAGSRAAQGVPGQQFVHFEPALDYLIWACANKLPSHLPVRRALAALDDDADRVASACEVVAQTLRDPRVLEEFYARSRSRERVVTPFNIEALVKETSDLFEDGARVTVNSRYPMVGLQPVINGRVVSLTAEQRRVLDLFDHAYQLDYGVSVQFSPPVGG